MPKQGTRAEVNTFIKGLITEASPLNFPANASFDEENFELHRDGTRSRRFGMDLEDGYGFNSTAIGGVANDRGLNTYVWEMVNGDPNKEFLVVQAGNQIKFYDTSLIPLSTGYVGTLVSTFPTTTKYSFTSVQGKLVVVGGGTHVDVIEYKASAFTTTSNIITVRDVWGVQEENATIESDPTFQTGLLTYKHIYNLQNQSWGIPRKDKAGTLKNPVSIFTFYTFRYPTNAQSVWAGMTYQPVVGTAEPFEVLYPGLMQDRIGATVNAARGYYIIDLLSRGASRASAVTANVVKYPEMAYTAEALPNDYHETGPTVVCRFAGRVFYSGFSGEGKEGDKRSPNLGSMVFFSKLVTTDANITQCYQEGDPTSRENSEIVDTDGGFVNLLGATRILGMEVLGSKLIVMAENGVWALSGGAQGGFTATNYKTDKLSSFGCIGASSVVVQGNSLMYWGKDAIYNISPNQYGDLLVDDFTAPSIQSLYNDIPDAAKIKANGVYDPTNKRVRWLYRIGGFFENTAITKELIFDTMIKSFSQYRINPTPGYTLEVADLFFSQKTAVPVQYLILRNLTDGGYNVDYTFGSYLDATFYDWKRFNGIGVDAKGYLLTGAITANDSAIDKQAPYLTMHLRKTETGLTEDGSLINGSSCLMRAQWEWATNVNSKKFSSIQEVYKHRKALLSDDGTYDNGFATTISKSKLRGKGKALSLYFETSPAMECHILGWSLTINGNGIT